jgi:hypothetical protein
MTDVEIQVLATRLAPQIAQQIAPHLMHELKGKAEAPQPHHPAVPRRMSTVDFGACVRHHPVVVRRHVSDGRIPSRFVEGGGKGKLMLIDRQALQVYNVSLEVAAERLEAARARALKAAPTPPPSLA